MAGPPGARASARIELGLDRLRAVLERLRFRRPAVPVLTIAGTNGKGSVVATCAAILTAAGYRTGTFTSPHLRDYRERIRLGDTLVDEASLLWAFERIERARGDIGLTFFEYNTLAAFLIFEAAKLDAWVLEIGLGGRLDAVNVVDPDVAVVVSIGFDHREFLGDTLDAIGREKAGIFRRGRAAVLGGRALPPVIFETALCSRRDAEAHRRGLRLPPRTAIPGTTAARNGICRACRRPACAATPSTTTRPRPSPRSRRLRRRSTSAPRRLPPDCARCGSPDASR